MSARARIGLRAATVAVGLASVALLATPASAGPAGAPGNNGTVKIHEGAGEPSPEPQNEPHVCTFHVHALHFDSGQVLTFTVQSWEPTGDRSVVLTGSITADATGAGRSPETGTYGLPDGHYRLTVDTGNGTSTRDKHKMFWVRCAPATTPPPSTSPPPTSPPSSPPSSPGSPPTSPGSSPTSPSGPGTPTSGAPSSSGAPTTPSVGGIPPVPPGTPPSAGGLASTGSATAAITGIGLALLLAGFVLLRIPATRRRLLGD